MPIVRHLFAIMLISTSLGTAAGGEVPPHVIPPEQARQRLLDGNQRFVQAHVAAPHRLAERRTEVAAGQHPIAVIVTCSDSRVPPELLFDQGLGDLFVIRLAGNVLDPAALGSIEYAVAHLNVTYLMVLGHERCGAVEAAVAGGETHGHIGHLVKAIQPAVDAARHAAGDLLDNAVRANATMGARQLITSEPIIAERVRMGALMIDAAHYDLDDGVVTMLPESQALRPLKNAQ